MDGVFVIKRKQKQTSCLGKPWRYGSGCFSRASLLPLAGQENQKSDKPIRAVRPENEEQDHLGFGKQGNEAKNPSFLRGRRFIIDRLCNRQSLFLRSLQKLPLFPVMSGVSLGGKWSPVSGGPSQDGSPLAPRLLRCSSASPWRSWHRLALGANGPLLGAERRFQRCLAQGYTGLFRLALAG